MPGVGLHAEDADGEVEEPNEEGGDQKGGGVSFAGRGILLGTARIYCSG
jgi:hypothetical protein